MTENKTPVDQALDLFVYAPLGFALSVRDEVPRLAERGKQQLDAQLTMARLIGKFAVGEAGRRLNDLTSSRSGPQNRPHSDGSAAQKQPVVVATAPRTTVSNGNGPRPSAEALAIHGYDALAASQVVPRLAGLSAEELEAVRAYEAATRRRKTILNRIDQLQSDLSS